MNTESDAVRRLLAWLQQDPNPIDQAPSGTNSSNEVGSDSSETMDPSIGESDPIEADQPINAADPPMGTFLNHHILSELGDIPAVQTRFQALLKRRLRSEIERNPPLFPWESQIQDYTADDVAELTTAGQSSAQFWGMQLQPGSLPTAIPDQVLNYLFNHCQSLVHTSLRSGERLVKAVEDLFPEDVHVLHQVAGAVLATPLRSGTLAAEIQATDPSRLKLPTHYEAANPLQQMALSLLAAQQLLETLTLTVSPSQPHTQRQWLTAVGTLVLTVEYGRSPQSYVRLRGDFPDQGWICLQGDRSVVQAERTNPGELVVELPHAILGATYPLSFSVGATAQTLHCAVQIAEDRR
jgi:hypothetical protein